ncbi:MAG: helix-turn-helix domain-containing protein [Candidatus Aminicenantes bacterium]|nr:helix-turn-helix domain-containing protein [Candidatus Aminicenantes bacterium]
MVSFKVIDILNFITSFQLFLLAGFLLSYSRGRKLSNRILAVFFLAHAVPVFGSILVRWPPTSREPFLSLVGIFSSLVMLWGPLLYLYARSLANSRFGLRGRHTSHFLPLLLYWAYSLTFLRRSSPKLFLTSFKGTEFILFSALINLVLIAYMAATLLFLRNYRAELKKSRSSLHKIDLSWLSFICLSFGLIWIVGIVHSSAAIIRGAPLLFLTILNFTLLFITATIMVFFSLRQPEVFREDEEHLRYEKSPLAKTDADLYLNILLKTMDNAKPYLEPGLTILGLAKKMDIPARYLSQVINESLRLNFFDFINRYRVDDVKRKLREADGGGRTILEIAFDAGFNSKAAFHRAFTKFVGMSPTEYREKLNRADQEPA